MAQSLSRVLVHLIFSTKHREPTIGSSVREELHAYLTGALENVKCPSLQTGGTADHVHILCALHRTLSVSELIEEVKTGSSKWMKTKGAANFAWQSGYGAFSVSESKADAVIEYIKTQEEHHRGVTFQEEFRKFLVKHRVEFDERYVWD